MRPSSTARLVAAAATLALLTALAAGVRLRTGDIDVRLPSADVLASLIASKTPDLNAYGPDLSAFGSALAQRLIALDYSNADPAALQAALGARGIPVLSLIEDSAVIVAASPADAISVAQAVPGVTLGPYSPVDAIAPEINEFLQKMGLGGSRRMLAAGSSGVFDNILDSIATRGNKYGLRLDVVPTLSQAALDAVQQHWPAGMAAKLGTSSSCAPEVLAPRLQSGQPLADDYETVLVFLCASDLLKGVQWLADQPSVKWIEPYIPMTKRDAQAVIIMQTGDISSTQFANPLPVTKPYWKAGIAGQNEIIGITDTGLDEANCNFQDPRYPYFYKNALAGTFGTVNNPDHRKIVSYTTVQGAVAIDADGHGTFCSSLIGGAVLSDPNNAASPTIVTDSTGNAPAAKIAFNDVDDGTLFPTDVYNDILQVHKAAGAAITSLSWGAGTSAYTIDCRNYDKFHWEQPMSIAMVAAGNDGNLPTWLYSTVVSSPGTAKNIVTCGASMRAVANKNDMAYFSSWGPAQDNRYKPDISAPGYDEVSARSQDMPTGSYTLFNTSLGPLCTTVQGSGTSFATPLTAGAVGIIRNYLRDGFYPTGKKTDAAASPFVPSGMLLKAILIGAAKSMKGGKNQKGGTLSNPPDRWTGFGRVNLKGGLPLAGTTKANFNLQVVDMDSFSSASDPAKTYTGLTTAGNGSVIVTLVWYDYPADVSANKAIVNDLDLAVTIGTKTVKGNTLETATTSSFDRINTIERVLFSNPAANLPITVTVRINSMPSLLKAPGSPQPFAVSVIGMVTGTLQTPFNPAWAKLNP